MSQHRSSGGAPWAAEFVTAVTDCLLQLQRVQRYADESRPEPISLPPTIEADTDCRSIVLRWIRSPKGL